MHLPQKSACLHRPAAAVHWLEPQPSQWHRHDQVPSPGGRVAGRTASPLDECGKTLQHHGTATRLGTHLEPDPLSIVEAYLAARDTFDYERARTYLADEGFEFESPVLRFDSADAFLQHMSLTSGIVQSIETRKVFVDGADVCHLQTYQVQISEKFSVAMAHWARVCDGRIVRIEVLFDASAYRDLFPGDA